VPFPYPEDLVFVRSYVQWEPPSDDDIQARFDLIYTAYQRDVTFGNKPMTENAFVPIYFHKQLRIDVATQFVRERLSIFLDSPDSFSIAGEYSESNARNPQVLRSYLDELQAMSDDGGVSIGQFVRDGGDYRSGGADDRVAGMPGVPRPGYR
jgi:hypothetical protein